MRFHFYEPLYLCLFPSVPDGPPLNIQFNVLSPDTVMFSWDPPLEELRNGIIIGYRIVCIVDSDRASDPVTGTGTQNSRMATVSRFTPATRYNCSLAAQTSPGVGVNVTVVVVTSKYDSSRLVWSTHT